jgi:hypothetical protein
LHIVNGYSLLLVTTSENKVYLFRLNTTGMEMEISLISKLQFQETIINVEADLALKGKGKGTNC